MKPFFYSIAAFALVVGCFTQKKINYDEPRNVPKHDLVPPGTVWLRDSTFIDITEIRTLDYLEFLYWTYRLDNSKYKAMLPDTTVWDDLFGPENPFALNYLRSTSYRNYPAVGVSYEQASAFCKWRAERINQLLYIQHHKELKNIAGDSIWKIKAPQYIECRLPSREEWEYAAAAGLGSQFKYGYISLTGVDNKPVSNTRESCLLRYNTVTGIEPSDKCYFVVNLNMTEPVESGYPNRYGIYNMLGNVSELIADTCFKGLSYQTTLDGATMKADPDNYQRIDSLSGDYDYHFTFRYKKPQSWLGFRCVCIVKQLPE